jgi:hypothetical protein
MSKKNLWDNSSLQQDIKWDNQELPGCPDEILLTKNWNLKFAAENLINSKEWQDKIKERTNSKEYKNAHSKAIKLRNQTKQWKESRNNFNKTKSKKVMTPNGIFNSRHEAATFYNITPPGITRRMKSYPDQYYYVIDKED